MAKRSADSTARLVEKIARKNMRAAFTKALETLHGKDDESKVKAAFESVGFAVSTEDDSLLWVDKNGVVLQLKSPGSQAVVLTEAPAQA